MLGVHQTGRAKKNKREVVLCGTHRANRTEYSAGGGEKELERKDDFREVTV